MLRTRARKGFAFGGRNKCTANDIFLLQELAYLHDIGKIEGAAKPAKSVEILTRHPVTVTAT